MPRVQPEAGRRKRRHDSCVSSQRTPTGEAEAMTVSADVVATANIIIKNSKAATMFNSNIMGRNLVTSPTITKIKSLREVHWDQEAFINNSWDKLKQVLTAIRLEMPTDMGLEETYQIVEQICSLKGQDVELSKKLTAEFREYAHFLLSQLLEPCDDLIAWLKRLERAWSVYCDNTTMIRNMFSVLDQMLVTNEPIWRIAVRIFERIVLADLSVRSKCVEGLLDLVKAERDGRAVDQTLMKNLFQMIDQTRVYATIFEWQFLKASKDYYKAVGVRLIDTLDVANFLEQANELIEKEKQLAALYLDSESGGRLLQAVEVGLMDQHITVILERGLTNMLDQCQLDLLHVLYKLFQPVASGHNDLCKAYSNYIRKVGTAFMNDADSDSTKCIANVLEFKDRLDEINANSFNNDGKFLKATINSLEAVLAAGSHPPAELVARFIDSKLRASKPTLTEDDLETLLTKVVMLFHFVPDKDMFEAFYQRLLAKRLLQSKSASFEMERAVLNRLKNECGPDFTSKMEMMFKDMELSRELNHSFRGDDLSLLDAGDSLEMSVSVLSNINWPKYESSPVNLPAPMLACKEKFESFYLNKYSGRRITWEHSVGSCVMTANFLKGEKELHLFTYQAIVLLLFNRRDTLTYSEIKDLTAIDDSELKRTLQSLSCGKFRIILRNSKDKELAATDTFTFNKNFENKMVRIKINQVQIKEMHKEKEETYEQLRLTRMYQLDATIVRVMKMKRRLSHNEMIDEVCNRLTFKPTPNELKERIECMIDQGYLSRDAEKTDYYAYVA